MLWFLVTCLLTLADGFPFHSHWDGERLGNVQVQTPHQKPSLCIQSPLLGKICLPPAFNIFMPLQTLEEQRRISIPLMRAHVAEACPSTFNEKNLSETSKEIIKEVEAEAEKERLSGNTNIEVNGEEVEPENFVKKENGVDAKESKVEGKNIETKNKIIRVSEEIMEVNEENRSPEKILLYKNFQDENISISSNLV